MQRLFSRFADLPMAAKLALLSGVAVLASLLIAYGGRTGLADLKSASDTEVELSRARASLHHLDTRNSELKVDAYRALSDDPEAVAGDVVDDVATVDEVLATLAGLELPADIRSAIDAVGEVNREFGAFIVEYVDLAQSDPDAALARIDEIADRNHELDDTLELIGEEVDADLAASVEERQSTFDSTNTLLLLVLVGAVLVVGGLSVVISRSIMRRTRAVLGALDRLADRDLLATVGVTGKDEFGRMATSLGSAMASTREAMVAISASSQGLAAAAEELSNVSTEMTGSAEQSSGEAAKVSHAAENVSEHVASVAAGAEQMSAAISEISSSAATAAGIAATAVGEVATARSTMEKLDESSTEIGNVVTVITQIAEQTNLLALNATIEAARAGDSGKGFAVVASEVKDLAQETSKATASIAERVAAIQTDASEALDAIGRVSETIQRIAESQHTIASAVEEQSATTLEIGRAVTEASQTSNGIADGAHVVADVASATTQGASQTRESASELARMASELDGLVRQFRY